MSEYRARAKTVSFQTKYRLHFINITKTVEDFIRESGVRTGTITLTTQHTTCGLWLNEDEKNLIGPEEELGYLPDLKRVLDRFAGPQEKYHHNDICDAVNPNGKRNTHLCEPDGNGVIRECINGHAHAHNLLLPSQLTLIVKNGRLLRGTWQEVLLVELDHDRKRQVTMLMQGVIE